MSNGLTTVQESMQQGGQNLAVNGALDLWQRVESTTTTQNTASTLSSYTADMIKYGSSGPTVKNYSIANGNDSPAPSNSGFSGSNCYLFTMLSGISSLASGDVILPFSYLIDGYTAMNLFGRTRNISFWFKPTLTGTYSISVQNIAANRSIVKSFSATGGVWQFIKVPFTFESGVSYVSGATVSYVVYISAVNNSGQTTSSLGVWQSGNFVTANTATNWTATTNNAISITQFSIPNTPLGYSQYGFQRFGNSYANELREARRYYCKSYPQGTLPAALSGVGARYGVASGTNTDVNLEFGMDMASLPTMTFYSYATGASGKARDVSSGADVNCSLTAQGSNSSVANITSTDQHQYAVHFTAEAGL